MADPNACQDWYFHPAKSGEYGGEGGGEAKQLLFSFFKNAVTIAEV